MASNTEIATSRIILDGKQAEDELKRLGSVASDLKKKLKLAIDTGDTTGAKKLQKELSSIEKEAAAAKREMNSINAVMKNLNGSSLKQLTQAQRQLTAEIRKSTRYTKEEIEEINIKKKQLLLLKAEIDKVQSSMALQKGGFMGNMANGFNKYFTMASSAILAVSGVALSLKSMISGNAELSDSFADVAKTTGLTTAEVKDLYSELGKLDTRTSRKELLDLAYAAGKLGYTGKSEIAGFVKAADQIGVALSKDLGGTVEEAVTSLGKLVDIFKLKDQFGIEQALLKTGSAINSLGAAGSANEAYIVDFTNRLGGIAPQAGMSIDQVMGLGATLDQLAQQVETSSTSVTQLITKMFSKPADYAKIAGLSVVEFTKLIKTDANGALIKLLEGLNKNKGGLTELAAKFSDMGVDGARAISVIGALSNNVDMLKEAQQLSNTELAKGTSITKEANLKNENMAGNLERIGKALKAAFVNSSVIGGLESIVSKIAEWTKTPLSETLEDERIKVNTLTIRLIEANTSLDDRKKIINELKTLAPSVVKDINAEAIAYNTLRANLAEYNKEQMNRIIVQKYQQEIDKNNTDLLDVMNNQLDWEEKLLTRLLKVSEAISKSGSKHANEFKQIMTSGADPLQKALSFEKLYNKYNIKGDVGVGLYIDNLLQFQKEQNELEQKNSGITATRERIMEKLGITTAEVNTEVETNNELTNYSILSTEKLNELAKQGDKLAETEIEIRKKNKNGVKELSDAFKVLDEQISEYDRKIRNAIGSGDIPLAQKLSKERQAAVDLKEAYTELEKQIQKGWVIPTDHRTDMGPAPQEFTTENLISRTATKLLSKDKLKSPLVKRDIDLSGTPSDQAKATEQADQQRREDWRNAEYDMASAVNSTIFNMVRDRQQAELDSQISILEKQREAELANKNLTEAQKDAINNKYDAKARKAKQDAWKKQRNADAVSTTIATILAVMKAGGPLNPVGALTALAGALSVISIMTQKVPEFAKGRYNVTGAQTGKQYNNVGYTGPAVTGLYTQPALVAENGSEMIIDSRTTKNLMMNYPAVIDAINSARMPQYASGRYPAQNPAPEQTSSSTIPDMSTAMHRFADAVDKLQKDGVRGNWSLFDLEKIQKNKSQLESATDM